jgi:hypothetical protein
MAGRPLPRPLQHAAVLSAPKGTMNPPPEGAENPLQTHEPFPDAVPMLEAMLKRSRDIAGDHAAAPGGSVLKRARLDGPSSGGTIPTAEALTSTTSGVPATPKDDPSGGAAQNETISMSTSAPKEPHFDGPPSEGTPTVSASQRLLSTTSSPPAPMPGALERAARDEFMSIMPNAPTLEVPIRSSRVVTAAVALPKVPSLKVPVQVMDEKEAVPPSGYEPPRRGPYHPAYPPYPSYIHPQYTYPPFGYPQDGAYHGGPYSNFWRAPPDPTLSRKYPAGEDGYQDGKGGGGDDEHQENVPDVGYAFYGPPQRQAEGPRYQDGKGGDDGYQEKPHDARYAFYGPPRRQAEAPHETYGYPDGYGYTFGAGPSRSREPSQVLHDPYHPHFHQGPPTHHASIPPPPTRRILHAARHSPMPPQTPVPESEQEILEGPEGSGSGGPSL